MENQIYLIQSDYLKTQIHLSSLSQIADKTDPIILMGEAALHYNSSSLHIFENVYVLQADKLLVKMEMLPSNLKFIDYQQFAKIILQSKHCIRLN